MKDFFQQVNKYPPMAGHEVDFRSENVREAQGAIKPHLNRLHSIIVSALNNMGGEGTKDEIAAFTCLQSEQIHKRMSELEKNGKVEPNGKRMGNSGRSITVWKLK
jgi:transcription initiation factor IIE alpha subunit